MKHVRKSVLLWYSPKEMYDLVTAIEDYPRFLPWCNSAEVLEQHHDGVTARLGLAYMGVRHAFTTRNHHVPGKQVTMFLVNGPFSALKGSWHFRHIAQPAAQPGHERPACKVEFDLRYSFSSRTLGALVSPVFERVAETFVDSFVRRAAEVHGQR